MSKPSVIGLDTAKNVFHVVCCDQRGKVIQKKTLRRARLLEYFGQHPSCLIGIEACSGSHYWARELKSLGHQVKLIPAQHVAPYRRGQKNDYNDALAIAEAIVRPQMRFVAIKSVEQQDQALVVHKRQQIIEARTQHINRIRAMLTERGIVIAKGQNALRQAIPGLLEDSQTRLSAALVRVLQQEYDYLLELDKQLAFYQQEISRVNAGSGRYKKLLAIPGFGPVVTSALMTHLGNGRQFGKGRDAAASLGLTPGQHSSGGKMVMLGISKRGDPRLRALLVHGARSAVRAVGNKQDPLSQWLRQLIHRVGIHKATVAYANKMVRIAWAVIRHALDYDPSKAARSPGYNTL